MSNRLLAIVFFLSSIFAPLMGYLTSENTGERARDFTTLITPETYAFSIWSLIYLAIIVFAIYALFRPQGKILIPFTLANILAGLWPYVFGSGYDLLAEVVIFGNLACLIWAHLSREDNHVLQNISLGLFLGWVNAASWVSISTYMEADHELSGSAEIMLCVILGVIIFAVSAFLIKKSNQLLGLTIGAVTTWAFVAVGVQTPNEYIQLLVSAFAVLTILLSALHVRENGKLLSRNT